MSSITPRFSPEFRESVQQLPFPNQNKNQQFPSGQAIPSDAFPVVIKLDQSQPRIRRSHSMDVLGPGASGRYAASQVKLLAPDEVYHATVHWTPGFSMKGATHDLDSFVRAFKSPDGNYSESAVSRITGLQGENLPKDAHGLRYTLASLIGGATAPHKGSNRVTAQDLKASVGFEDFWSEDNGPTGRITPEKRQAIQQAFLIQGDDAQARVGHSKPFSLARTDELGLDFDPELQKLLDGEAHHALIETFVQPPTSAAIQENVSHGFLSPDSAKFVLASAERIKPYTGKSVSDVFAQQNNVLRDKQNREGFNQFRNFVAQVGKNLP